MAGVDGRANTLSSTLKDGQFTVSCSVFRPHFRFILRAIIHHNGQVHKGRQASDDVGDVQFLVSCRDDHADVPALQHALPFGAASINLCLKAVPHVFRKNRFDSLKARQGNVSAPLERVVLIGRDIELRIVSLIVRCREVANEVILFDTGSNDETVDLAHEVGCKVVHHNGDLVPQHLAKAVLSLESFDGLTLCLPITARWKLSDLPLSVNRAREGWDIHHLYREASSGDSGEGTLLSSTELGHLILSPKGAEHLAGLSEAATTEDIADTIRARFVKSGVPIQLPQRQSLATASRFAQLFYWMLESKHPLLLFGIPGVVLFVLGYRLSGDLASMFTELNSTSIGVTLITIAMTLIGLFAMMVALILYIMGKQVARIQNQYNWPKGS